MATSIGIDKPSSGEATTGKDMTAVALLAVTLLKVSDRLIATGIADIEGGDTRACETVRSEKDLNWTPMN